MNKKFFLLVLLTANIIFTTFLSLPKYSKPKVSTPSYARQIPSTGNVTLIVNYGPKEIYSYQETFKSQSTVFSLLEDVARKEDLSLETTHYDFGIFVKSLNGKESSANMAWMYYVNGNWGQIAADQMKVNPGDTVEWKYEKPL